MYCSHCGTSIPADMSFCPQCGRRVGSGETLTPADWQNALAKLKSFNPHLFTFPLWVGVVLILIRVITNPQGVLNAMAVLIGYSCILFAYVYSLIALYRTWAVMQYFNSRTTPGKAVGFLFIPFFNIYWIFVSIRGLAKDINEISDRAGLKKHVSTGLSTASCILSLIPYINFTLNLILINILVYQWADFHREVRSQWDKLNACSDTAASGKSHSLAILVPVAVIAGVAVIGILAAIAIPQFVTHRDRGYCALVKSEVKSAYTAAQAHLSDYPEAQVRDAGLLKSYGYTKNSAVNLSIDLSAKSGWIMAKSDKCKKIYMIDYTGNVTEQNKNEN
jgi:type II secretory pathway pseudopilin PulG